MIADILLIAGVALGTALALWAYRAERRRLYVAGKVGASLAFVVLALRSGVPQDRWAVFIAAALVCAAAGDILLSGRARGYFVAGFILFVVAHVLYVVGFALRGSSGGVFAACAAVTALAATLAWRWLSPHLEGWVRKAVPAYLVIVSLMAATGWASALSHAGPASAGASEGVPQAVLLGVGATMVYFSDLAVGRERFVVKAFTNKLLGLPAYYVGQVLIALAISWRLL